jgi:hypothetical protein
MVATLALAIGLAADIVVIAKIAHSVTAGLAAAAAACTVLVALWHISPYVRGSSRTAHRMHLHVERP